MNKGKCTFCKTELNKNKSTINSHIKKCEDIKRRMNYGINSNYLLLSVESKYDKDYWLVFIANKDISLKEIDNFLRDIWVECCDHLSDFYDNRKKISKSMKIMDVFEDSKKIDYIYDYGSTTNLQLKIIDEYLVIGIKDEILILFRNSEIAEICSECKERNAKWVCTYCYDGEDGLICDECISNHDCVIENGDEILLPIVNSPRVGECGYCGSEDKYIKKYFPKEII